MVIVHAVGNVRVSRALNRFREAGLPITPEELNASYTMPEGPNAADLYMRAIEKADIDRTEIKNAAAALRLGDPSMANALLDRNREMLALMRQAAGVAESRYPSDILEGREFSGGVISHVGRARRTLETMLVDAEVRFQSGDVHGAAQTLLDALAFTDSFHREPHLITQLVRMAMLVLTVNSLDRFLDTGSFPAEDLEQLQQRLAASDSDESFHNAIAGEVAMGNVSFQLPASKLAEMLSMDSSLSSGSGTGKTLLVIGYQVAGLSTLDRALYLDFMWESYQASGLPMHERISALKAIGDRAERTPPIRILFLNIFSSLHHASALDIRTRASARSARVALAVERFRLEHGALPDSLDALVPRYIDAIPEDPFTGKPLLYRKLEPAGYAVYSVGEDSTDNQGLSSSPTVQPYTTGSDIPFRVER